MNHFRAYTRCVSEYSRAFGAPRPGSRRGVLLWVQKLTTADGRPPSVALNPAKRRRQRAGNEAGGQA